MRAAAMLSVAAVVTGMSLSTPESKPMTGIFCAWAFCSSGIAALLSSAAKAMALGFLPSAVVSISICLSTIDSLSGPSNVMRTLKSVAALSEPALTACQNWCWKPLEMIAMYVSPAAAAGAVVGAAAAAGAAVGLAAGAAVGAAAGAVVGAAAAV